MLTNQINSILSYCFPLKQNNPYDFDTFGNNLIFYCSAYEEYKTAMATGEDGRPDWSARKSCNYITASIEVKYILSDPKTNIYCKRITVDQPNLS